EYYHSLFQSVTILEISAQQRGVNGLTSTLTWTVNIERAGTRECDAVFNVVQETLLQVPCRSGVFAPLSGPTTPRKTNVDVGHRPTDKAPCLPPEHTVYADRKQCFTMADAETELSLELTRIIACPYPASLTKLADILARANGFAVRKCILDRPPCAILKLAAIISAALPLWAYTLRILQSLCHSSEFRDKLLFQHPGLLTALLTKANASQHDFDESSELCVLLLSKPLPEAVPLPAGAQSFFLRVFERAIKTPEVRTLKPIYCMLNGACRDLLTLLPSEARHTFDKELCQILSSNSTGPNSMLLLWCFGIIILAERPQEVANLSSSFTSSEIHTPNVAPTREWSTISGRKLFGSASGLHKTINLTYLSVIWATKGGVGVSDVEAVECIKIAIRTMQFIPKDVRQGWPSSSALAKNSFPKLATKILRKGIHPSVQIEALCFYALIVGENALPFDIVVQYEEALLKVAGLQTDANSSRQTLQISLPLFAVSLSPLIGNALSDFEIGPVKTVNTAGHLI
ncbi:uncharacterized protein BDR25DRAFT_45253, partial [Lindgomyces ingoldianus]